MVRAIASTCITGILFVGVLTSRGWFEKTFADFGYDDFGVTLPGLTNVVRSAFFVWLLGFLFGLTIVKEFLVKSGTARAACNTVAFYAALVLGALYTIGMLLPLNVLIERISN